VFFFLILIFKIFYIVFFEIKILKIKKYFNIFLNKKTLLKVPILKDTKPYPNDKPLSLIAAASGHLFLSPP